VLVEFERPTKMINHEMDISRHKKKTEAPFEVAVVCGRVRVEPQTFENKRWIATTCSYVLRAMYGRA